MKYTNAFLIVIILLLLVYIATDKRETEKVVDKVHEQLIKEVDANNKNNSHETIAAIAIQKEKKSSKVKVINEPSTKHTTLNLGQSDLLKLLGNEKALKWKEEYDKGIYDPNYDVTWKDDMLSEAYSLISYEKYEGKMEISEFKCDDEECTIDMADLSTGTANLGDYSDYMLDLKYHPAILKSGKKRNVYLSSIVVNDEGRKIKISIK